MAVDVTELPLPEQLYLLLFEHDTGKPRAIEDWRVGRALGMAMLVEWLLRGRLAVDGPLVTSIAADDAPAYLAPVRAYAMPRMPVGFGQLVCNLGHDLHPLWRPVGEALVASGLVQVVTRKRWGLLTTRSLQHTAAGVAADTVLRDSVRHAAHALRQAGGDPAGAGVTNMALARLLILDNYGLLRGLLAHGYDRLRPLLPGLRVALHEGIHRECNGAGEPCPFLERSGGDYGV